MNQWLPDIEKIQPLVRAAMNDLNQALENPDSAQTTPSEAAEAPGNQQGTEHQRRLRDIERLVQELSGQYERLLQESEARVADLTQQLEERASQPGVAGAAQSDDDHVNELMARLSELEQALTEERERNTELAEQIEVERRTHAAELHAAQIDTGGFTGAADDA